MKQPKKKKNHNIILQSKVPAVLNSHHYQLVTTLSLLHAKKKNQTLQDYITCNITFKNGSQAVGKTVYQTSHITWKHSSTG